MLGNRDSSLERDMRFVTHNLTALALAWDESYGALVALKSIAA